MKANILVTLSVCGKGVSLAAQTANLNSVLGKHFRNFFVLPTQFIISD